ncbi:SLC13 family permease [Chelatococcus reniformis]|uniref:Permease n=1 Tax=Chelatococcus reniformis TaxID=1494448 RepID=A0A916X955_9HYPH|nr:SLC13 family permease [Chelatococcus reniformis]GGC53708.1 permease [Chelatococcus reniformis]
MTLEQILSVAIVVAMMALFVHGRLRYDIVAGLALLAAVAAGLVPVKDAFKGFSDDIVIIVGSALVVSAAVSRSGLIETALGRLAPHVRSTQMQVVLLVFAVAVMSAIIKNIGALAMMLPIAYQLARRDGKSPSVFLMPMAFASLLGGIVTLVGTSPNIIVARVREELTGHPFTMFDYTPVGLGLAVAGCLFLCFGYRLLPRERRGAETLDQALDIADYVTEVRVPADSRLAGKTIADLKAIAQGEADVVAILRQNAQLSAPLPDASLRESDTLLLRGEPKALERVVAEGRLQLEGEAPPADAAALRDQIKVSEAIVAPNSMLVGCSVGSIDLKERYRVNLLAISRAGERFKQSLRSIVLRSGDVLVVQGNEKELPDRLRDLGLLPLVERSLALGSERKRWLTGLILLATVLAIALDVVPVAAAFFGAAVILIAVQAIAAKDAYEAIDWPILIMLGALIPVSETLRTTGMTDTLARSLASVGGLLPPWGALALLLAAAMAVTPFLNNAATVLVMAPIGAEFATSLGYRPDGFLMAVAIGAACDFLTPVGHQCNTLVMGPGGYRFGDYARLGAPLSLLVILLGVPLIMLVWPLR